VLKNALEAGKSVEEFATEKSAIFQQLADEWNISNNDFIRTTEERHLQGAQKFWQAAVESGAIYKKAYTALYCIGCEEFKTEKDLVDGKCPLHNKEPETVSEENYFFRLSRYQEPLEFLFKKYTDFVYPEFQNTFIKNNLDNIELLSTLKLEKIQIKTWQNEPFIEGATSVYSTGTFDVKSILKKNHGRIHFAGEHLGNQNGTMEAALLSAIDAINGL
jgi:leucyl-tRNA synthetase